MRDKALTQKFASPRLAYGTLAMRARCLPESRLSQVIAELAWVDASIPSWRDGRTRSSPRGSRPREAARRQPASPAWSRHTRDEVPPERGATSWHVGSTEGAFADYPYRIRQGFPASLYDGHCRHQ